MGSMIAPRLRRIADWLDRSSRAGAPEPEPVQAYDRQSVKSLFPQWPMRRGEGLREWLARVGGKIKAKHNK